MIAIKKTIEPTGDLCIKFTDDELKKLNIEQNDKFSIREKDGNISLEKYEKIDLDISEFRRDILEFLIKESCDKDISVNDIICNILESFVQKNKINNL